MSQIARGEHTQYTVGVISLGAAFKVLTKTLLEYDADRWNLYASVEGRTEDGGISFIMRFERNDDTLHFVSSADVTPEKLLKILANAGVDEGVDYINYRPVE